MTVNFREVPNSEQFFKKIPKVQIASDLLLND